MEDVAIALREVAHALEHDRRAAWFRPGPSLWSGFPRLTEGVASVDRHSVWRRAQTDYEAVKNRAGQGYEAFVQAWIAGRPDPIPLGFVTTRRGRDEVWIRLESETLTDPEEDDDTIPAECFWLYVHENALLAVEVGFRRSSGAPCGFGYVEEPGYGEQSG